MNKPSIANRSPMSACQIWTTLGPTEQSVKTSAAVKRRPSFRSPPNTLLHGTLPVPRHTEFMHCSLKPTYPKASGCACPGGSGGFVDVKNFESSSGGESWVMTHGVWKLDG